MEQWITNGFDNLNEQQDIIKLWLPLFKIHEEYERDILFLDCSRTNLLFDDKGQVIPERWDSNNSFWNVDNPLPINSISSDDDIINLWRGNPKSVKQPVEQVEWMIKIKNKYPSNCLIVVQNVEVIDEIPVPTLNCHMVQTLRDKRQSMLVSTFPNSKFNWYCKHCAKIGPKKRCPKCAPPQKPIDDQDEVENFSRYGTYYCNEECQKADWKKHKLTCTQVKGSPHS